MSLNVTDRAVFSVERLGLLDWAVYASWKYGRMTVGRFWSRGAAGKVADNLSRIACAYDWKVWEQLPVYQENGHVVESSPAGGGPDRVHVSSLPGGHG